MNCSAKGVPRPTLSWTFDNQELPPDATISNFSYQSIIRLFTTSKSMEGWYTCKAKNKAGLAAANSFLYVLEKPPTVTMSSKAHPSLIEGERLALTCAANEATEKIQWTKDNVSEIARASIRQIGKSSTLVIEKVLTSDSGNYSCMALNNVGSASSSVYINVTVFPVVAIYPRNQTVLEGRPTTMNCTAKGVPRPTLSWTFDNQELPPDAAMSNSSYQSILRLFSTSKSMEGWYTCKAKNKAGVTFKNSFLYVLEKPPTVTMSSKPHPSLLEGERLALTCVANEATKEIKWTKDNVSEITRASTREIGKNSTLVIEKVLTSDSGYYSCMAVNNAGSASSSVYINVTDQDSANDRSPIRRPNNPRRNLRGNGRGRGRGRGRGLPGVGHEARQTRSYNCVVQKLRCASRQTIC
ncbi:peroxidasin homolog [Acropora millepora]|uniref:peroxidasin homolog n=1 Tax=Acropora millepora TaxID=45264 RepID=UPI001CF2CBCF|nr:peroxidasin homolog [Acropora millepora]